MRIGINSMFSSLLSMACSPEQYSALRFVQVLSEPSGEHVHVRGLASRVDGF